MAVLDRGARTPETRKSRLSLTGWRDRHSAQPAKIEPANDSPIANPIQAWESWLWSERNRWSVDQHRQLNRRSGQFLGQIAVEDFALSDKQADWLAKLLERAGLPPLADGGDHER